MTEKTLVVDVSLYQPKIDWKVLAENGVAGVIAKASSGSFRKDPLFLRHVQEAKAAGLVVGAYHWCDPSNDDLAQAKNFLSTIQNQPVGFLAVDMEQYWQVWAEFYDRNITTIISGKRISENAYRVASYLRKYSGLPVLIYTRASFVYFRAPQAVEWLSKFPLWLAHYPYSRDRVTTTWIDLKKYHLPKLIGPLMPPNCNSWVFWQFSGDKFRLPGTNGLIDLNYFNGSKDDLDYFIRTGQLPERVENESPLPRKAKALARLNVRSEPQVGTRNFVGKIEKGTIMDVLETRWIGMDKWARIGENLWVAMQFRNALLMVWNDGNG
jgi:GH25 family lysozyme M1 (1,4-beta-N-acetylmuramidase)